MKVLSVPKIEEWTCTADCYQCKSKLQADHNDLKHKMEKKWSDSGWGDSSSSWMEDVFYVECPMCTAHITVNGDTIPYLLLTKVKKVK